jgi:hypothetical protein
VNIDYPFDPTKLPDPNLTVPDLAEAVEGWRAWDVERALPKFGLPPKLTSVTYDYYWTPHRAGVAVCEKGCEKRQVPGESCTCGFYAAKTLDHLLGMGYPVYDPESSQVCVIGQLALWGKVIEGTQGWRASKAYPKKLWVPFEAPHLAAPLREAYGVPVGLKNFIQPKLESEN